MTSLTTPLRIASWLAEHGMHVFPLRPGSKRPFGNCPLCRDGRCIPDECKCLTRNRPCHGYKAATLDPVQIRRWWSWTANANVGIATGPSGLVVLDLDCKAKAPEPAGPGVDVRVSDGLAAFEAITAAEGQAWPDTLTVATPSDGRHLYFTATDQRVVSDASGKVGHQIDIRAEGGYVVAPGCEITAPPEDRAGAYTRLTGVEIAPLPGWLQARLAPPPRPAAPMPAPSPSLFGNGGHAPGYWQQVWSGELGKVETEPGERWRIVYASARRLANLAAHDTAPWTQDEAIEALTAAALRRRERTGKPLDAAAARRNARKGWERGTADGPDSLRGLGGAA
ncbi:bifunctional DNA primase/polymerase [Saccharopolyspora endophytica]|uniref:Rep1 n=1 Tax=Saccharopolyspora endophytica TaxID=543886 RepID=A0A0C5BHU4_9PSEU|nr:bifunctional DNA primase/polymerase [Saccharopolyspora endophytica]AJM87327.1 Rep1 [Saccharopolyspora endophytica]